MIPNPIIKEQPRGLCLAHGLLFGHDGPVANWTWNEFRLTPMPVVAAIGIVRNNMLIGSVLFQDFSGFNVEMSYYGPATPSAGIFKTIARYVIERFNVDRVSIRTNRKNASIMRILSRIGFRTEGVQRRYYGPFGDAALFVLFREDIERIAGFVKKD